MKCGYYPQVAELQERPSRSRDPESATSISIVQVKTPYADMGTLRWQHSSPYSLDITFIASVAPTIFKRCNLYVRQCYWYSRITLGAMARAFPSCAREGTMSFSRRFSMFGRYKQTRRASYYRLRGFIPTFRRNSMKCLSLFHSRHSPRLSNIPRTRG